MQLFVFTDKRIKMQKSDKVNFSDFFLLIRNKVALNRGAGGIRTLVQTSNASAFYMFSFRLIFDAGLTGNGLTNA